MIHLNSPLKPNLKKLNKYLQIINDNGWYTNFGPLHEELTSRLEEYLGVTNLLLVNNGTTALQVAGSALGTQSILTTPFSFVATTSAFKWQQKEVAFCDIDRGSYNLSPEAVRNAYLQGSKADTIVATHVYGNPCDVAILDEFSESNNIKIIYDAAHAFGVKINNESLLNYGDASTLSFHATKVFHTIEGGAIIFKKADDFEKAKNLINFGIKPGKGIIDVGFNGKLNEYQAAVGLVNLDEIDNVLDHRANLFNAYRHGLKGIVEMPIWHSQANMNGAYMPIRLKDKEQLNKAIKILTENNVQSRHYFSPSLDEVFINEVNYNTENSKEIAECILCLPMHAHMTLNDIKKIVTVINSKV